MPAFSQDLALYFAFMILAMSIASLPLAPATLLAVKIAPPWAVASLATVAAAIAATFDYAFIRRAFQLGVLQRLRRKRMFQVAERWAKVAPFWTTATFAGLPLPFTITRILMPLSGYPRARYVLAVALGRFPRIFVIAAFGTFFDIPTDVLVGLLVAGVVIVTLAAIARKLGFLPSFGLAEEAEAPPAEGG